MIVITIVVREFLWAAIYGPKGEVHISSLAPLILSICGCISCVVFSLSNHAVRNLYTVSYSVWMEVVNNVYNCVHVCL